MQAIDGILVAPVAHHGSEQIIPAGWKPDAFEAPAKLALGGGGNHRFRCSFRWQNHRFRCSVRWQTEVPVGCPVQHRPNGQPCVNDVTGRTPTSINSSGSGNHRCTTLFTELV
jgi:hypothetical protein